MLSEKSYWLILIISLVVFLFIDCLWIMPTSRDIGVNLFTDAIFMMITIVFLSVIYKLREEGEWKPAERRVIGEIEENFISLMELIVSWRSGEKSKKGYGWEFLSIFDNLSLIEDSYLDLLKRCPSLVYSLIKIKENLKRTITILRADVCTSERAFKLLQPEKGIEYFVSKELLSPLWDEIQKASKIDKLRLLRCEAERIRRE